MSRTARLVASLGLVLACGDSTGTDVSDPASLTLVPSQALLESIGATVGLEATVRDALGNALTATVDYQSSDIDVATVNGSGIVTAVGQGTATITATAGELTRESQIDVTQLPADLRIVSGNSQSAVVGTALADPLVVVVTDERNNAIDGADVTFSLGLSPGALSAPVVTTDASGNASVTLTLDTLSGAVYTVTATVTTGRADPVTFAATGLADMPTGLGATGGDLQVQPVSTTLPDDVTVQVVDQYGNGAPGVTVDFAVTGGGGSVNPASAVTDGNGFAAATWTLGSTLGAQTLDASATGAGLGTVTFNATGTNLAVTNITPATLVEGMAATITGVGFDPVAMNNTVTVDGVSATVTAATANTIDFTVPTGACKPAQSLDVVVTTAASGSTPATSHPWQPGNPVALNVGEQLILQDPANFCFQFLSAAADERYLLGIQSVSDVSSSSVQGRLIAEVPPGTPAPGQPAVVQPRRSGASPVGSERQRRWERHRVAESSLRQRQLEEYVAAISTARRAPSVQTRSQLAIDSTVQVGQTVSIKMPRFDGNLCTDSDNITVVVKAVGQSGIFLHDPLNPAGFTDQDYLDMSATFDNAIFATTVNYFGQPTDLDGNNRILVVVSKNLNEQSGNVLGFVNTADLESATVCPASNEAEVYYGRAPDASGSLGGFPYPRTSALEDAPPLIAHEFAHIIQVGRRVVLNAVPFMTFFMAEGQATLAEEVVGHAVLGNATGQNYGYAIALNDPQVVTEYWYAVGMTDVAGYFGFQTLAPNVSVAGAPAECTWVGPDPDPCSGRPLWYGVTWMFLRWLGDHYGSSFGGGEAEMHRLLVDNSTRGFQNVADVIGVPMDSLLAQWSAALYLDDRVGGLSAGLDVPSWDFVDIFDNGLPPSANLVPAAITYGARDGTFTVAAASTAYFTLSGGNRPDVAFRVVDLADAPLTSGQVYLVRIQ